MTNKFLIKISFTFFILFIFQFFLLSKVNAYSVPANNCQFNDASSTIYVFAASDLNGTLPLCFTADANATLTLRFGQRFETGSTINNSGTTTNPNYTFTGSTEYRVNFEKNFSISDLPVENNETNFFLKDTNSSFDPAPAKYTLTLRPAFRVKFLNPDYID